jgi:hypothetical protein
MRRVCTKVVPENFNGNQKARRNKISEEKIIEWLKT